MAFRSLNQFLKLRKAVVGARLFWLRRRGVSIGEGSTISMSGKVLGPVEIGAFTYIAFKTTIEGREPGSGTPAPVSIGNNCFIGGGSVIKPGSRVGDNCIVAAGAVVSGEVPPRSIVAGNPGRVIRRDIEVGKFGVLKGADENVRKYWKP